MKDRSAVLGYRSESPRIFGKIEHETRSKFGPSFHENIWTFIITESRFIEVSHALIGVQLPKLCNLEVGFGFPFWSLGSPYETQWDPVLKALGNTKKSNMKMG